MERIGGSKEERMLREKPGKALEKSEKKEKRIAIA